ncbi:uncharacterized protein LOC132937004 [Metopolophium dirhodum]|uniref:uncharacterized protein LOC132937004 n=1 Tax=Metopolophium dirhodum TaxID=44670 RepID=UPI00298FD352|nr:uncharacterized protein LOC132937004 [Metopolophium dirhodum]
MNCLKAVILLWTCIIAFHSLVTAFEIEGKDISGVVVNTCGGLLKTIEVDFVYIRIEKTQLLFDEIYKTPLAKTGPPVHITITYDKTPCNEQHEIQKLKLPVKFPK